MNSPQDDRPAAPGTRPQPPALPKGSAMTDTLPVEVNGPPGPEPTRHGDWSFGGRCSDF